MCLSSGPTGVTHLQHKPIRNGIKCLNASGFNEVIKECRGAGGCLVLILQKQLKALEIHFDNGSLPAEDSQFFALVGPQHSPSLPAGALRLQVLQDQLSQVRARQEHLLQQVDNFTRSPGLPLPSGLGLLRGG